MKLEGKVVFVTGAAHGQGASHARYLANEGARIVAVDICEDIKPIYPLATREELDGTVASINEAGGEAIAVQADVRSSSEMKAASTSRSRPSAPSTSSATTQAYVSSRRSTRYPTKASMR